MTIPEQDLSHYANYFTLLILSFLLYFFIVYTGFLQDGSLINMGGSHTPSPNFEQQGITVPNNLRG